MAASTSGVGGEALDLAPALEPVVKALVTTHIVILQVDGAELRVVPAEPVAVAIGLQHPMLRDPVELSVQRELVGLERGEHRLPTIEHFAVLWGVILSLHVLPRMLQVLPLQLHGVHAPAVGKG